MGEAEARSDAEAQAVRVVLEEGLAAKERKALAVALVGCAEGEGLLELTGPCVPGLFVAEPVVEGVAQGLAEALGLLV